ncbi:hypothetical protein BJ973_004370 [Actinoplanes tereljensis]|uniref:NACHT domain-containing protein n=1 Tax=Paractinoplanes tereljensis TaxID=571912 RepID=A0A919NTP4_9ACTN|nr:DUF4062 domain-containing protein [Actinoplanes tereljensis]GIF23759.1 hypothetical protein Ate02nite_64890 [Actinoplanes tereljensis]
MARIYVSSTFSDLKEYRAQVSLALRRLGHDDVAMEYYVAEDIRPLDRCLADVDSCDVYVGIFAWRYGFVPAGQELSITELEYQQARDGGKTCLVFILSDDAPWPRKHIDREPDRIERFREELAGEHRLVNTFENADDLARKVNEAVIGWERRSGLVGARDTDWYAYRQAVLSRHRWVRLQVIAGASKERDPLRIPLTEVFEPQLVAPGVSGTEVPDEVRQYQQEIYGSRATSSEDSDEELLLTGNPEQVLDVIGRERAQVVLGGPGSGKSTLLQYAMLRVCEPGDHDATAPQHLRGAPIPFLVELRSYVLQKDPDFLSHIVRRAEQYYATVLDARALAELLAEDQGAVIFFDGLDEVFDPDERRRVVDQFQTFIDRYQGARIVVTSRIAGYDRTGLGLAGFDQYTLMPLTLGHVRTFAERWYRHYTLEGTERTAQGLVQRIVESPRLLDLAGNPLLLTMMAVIYKNRDLPNERWRLYERCGETLLEDWELSKGIEDEDFKLKVPIRTAQKSEILQQVAMYMLEHNQSGTELNAIAYAPLRDIVSQYLKEKYQLSPGESEAIAVDILRHLMERTYVLAGIGERVFGFVHRTFMEYFAACRRLAQFNARKADFGWLTREVFGARWNTPEWEEVLLLLIAMLHDQGTPIHEVVDYLRTECPTSPPFNLAFAARCLGDAGDVKDPAYGQTVLAELARAIVEQSALTRRTGAQEFMQAALGAFASLAPLVTIPAAVQEAIAELDAAKTVAARTAAWQMGFAMRSRKERLAYALTALQDPQEAVRRGAIAALEREWPGRPDIGAALADVVKNDRQARVRTTALSTMQRSWRTEPAILDAIASRADQETAYTYVVRLIEYLAANWHGNPTAFDLVVRLSRRPQRTIPYEYDHHSVIKAAVSAVTRAWRTDPRAFTSIRDIVENDPDYRCREAAINAIAGGWAENDQAWALLRGHAIGAASPSDRRAAMRAIVRSRPADDEGLAFVRDTALHGAPPARVAAVGVLAELRASDPEMRALIQDLAAADAEPLVRNAAIDALASVWYQDPATVDFLCGRAVDDHEPSVRETALEAIGWSARGVSQALAFLRSRLDKDRVSRTRVTAFKVIAQLAQGRYGSHPSTDLTRAALGDGFRHRDVAVRRAAIGAAFDILGYRYADLGERVREFGIAEFLLDRARHDDVALVRDEATSAVFGAASMFGTALIDWRANPEDMKFLRHQAETAPDPDVRDSILRLID